MTSDENKTVFNSDTEQLLHFLLVVIGCCSYIPRLPPPMPENSNTHPPPCRMPREAIVPLTFLKCLLLKHLLSDFGQRSVCL